MSSRSVLELDAVTKEFPGSDGGTVHALSDINLNVPRGEFVSIVGASGSGKSTLLALIAGLAKPTSGMVRLDGYPVTGPGPDRGLVFQHGAVYPWRTVERNVSFGLELLPRLGRTERAERVAWYLEETGLTTLRRALPKQLSGGQRQRVAIARALVCEPEVLLLDEPFGALDPGTRAQMHALIRPLWREHGMTILMVTHDLKEAFALGTRLIAFDRPRLDPQAPGRFGAIITYDLDLKRDCAVPVLGFSKPLDVRPDAGQAQGANA
jgi:NitT/TauT family transport system ATP-binding protein